MHVNTMSYCRGSQGCTCVRRVGVEKRYFGQKHHSPVTTQQARRDNWVNVHRNVDWDRMQMSAYNNVRGSDDIPKHLKKIKVVVPTPQTTSKPKFKFLPAKDVRRALGVDYGRRHIGVAVSTLGLAPRPLQFIRGGGIVELMRMAQDVVDVAVAEQCDSIVVGLPVTIEGSLYKRATDSQQGRRCRNFAHTVFSLSEKHCIGVFLVDERGTSQEAGALLDIVGSRHRPKGRKDSVAAALILSTFFGDPSAALRVRSR